MKSDFVCNLNIALADGIALSALSNVITIALNLFYENSCSNNQTVLNHYKSKIKNILLSSFTKNNINKELSDYDVTEYMVIDYIRKLYIVSCCNNDINLAYSPNEFIGTPDVLNALNLSSVSPDHYFIDILSIVIDSVFIKFKELIESNDNISFFKKYNTTNPALVNSILNAIDDNFLTFIF